MGPDSPAMGSQREITAQTRPAGAASLGQAEISEDQAALRVSSLDVGRKEVANLLDFRGVEVAVEKREDRLDRTVEADILTVNHVLGNGFQELIPGARPERLVAWMVALPEDAPDDERQAIAEREEHRAQHVIDMLPVATEFCVDVVQPLMELLDRPVDDLKAGLAHVRLPFRGS